MKKTDINRYTTEYMDNKSRAYARKKTPRVFFMFLRTFLFVTFASFIIIIASIIFYMANNADQSVDLDLRSLKINTTSMIYVNNSKGKPVEYRAVSTTEKREWVDFDKIPQSMKDAIVSIEDKRFYEHHGVDWMRTVGAAYNFLTRQDSYGGSTITQQLIKNLTQKSEVSITRKISEIVNATIFEFKYTKDEILETYLNVVNFGNNCNGVQAAATEYFNKDISECTIAECACIAGITQNPTKYNPLLYPEQNKKRQQVVLYEMYDQGYITKEEYNTAMKQSESMKFSKSALKKSEKTVVNNWYIESMLQDVTADLAEKLKVDEDTASYMLANNGYKIYSAMDKNAQKVAEKITADGSGYMPSNTDIQVGYVMMDYDGRVLAIIGQRGKKEANLLWNNATTATRQPGSSFKPLAVYAPAFEYGLYNFSSLLADTPLTGVAGITGVWPPNWYGYYKGQMTLQHAVEISANAPAAQVVKELTPQESFKFVTQKLGISTLNEEEDCTYSGMATGGGYNGVTVEEMTAAFQVFGNGGVYNKPYTYYYVTDSSGKVILDNRDNKGSQAISSQTSTIMRKLLQTVITGSEGTGTAAAISGVTTYGKTGTTDENENSWFVGGTPSAVAGIWTGYNTPTNMSDSEAAYAISIWRAIMSEYIYSGADYNEFTDDSSVVAAYFCESTGMLACSGCPDTQMGYYTKDNQPAYCYTHYGQSATSSATSYTSSTASKVESEESSSTEYYDDDGYYDEYDEEYYEDDEDYEDDETESKKSTSSKSTSSKSTSSSTTSKTTSSTSNHDRE